MRTVYDADLLLVDDNPDLLRLLSDQLSGAGYRHIRTAANCAAAQTAFACKTPELMFWISTCRMATAFRSSAFCAKKWMFRRCFSPRATRTQTACSAWGLAQTTT